MKKLLIGKKIQFLNSNDTKFNTTVIISTSGYTFSHKSVMVY